MSRHRLERRQVVGGSVREAFGFFKDPMNLEVITPPWLRFRVVSSSNDVVRLGTEITYHLRWQVFPMKWRSRISEYEEDRLFADEMLRGPYASWYHWHYFEEVPNGVAVTDVVEYRLPFGPLGSLAHGAVVRRQLEAIFDYRYQTIDRLFRRPAVPEST